MAASKTYNLAVILSAVDKLTGPLSQASSKLNKFSQKTRKIGKDMSDLGGKMSTQITAPLTAIGIISGKAAIQFDDSMRKVKAMTGATGEDFNKLTNLAMKLGETTKFTASESAEGMTFLAMAGFKTNEIMSSMPGMLNLAAAAGVDLATAADIASDAMSMFGMKASDSNKIADILASTVTSTNTNMSQLFEAIKYIGPMAKRLKVPMSEVTGMIGLLGDNGLKGSMATRALGTALSRLSSPTSEMLEMMEATGFSAFDAQGNFIGLANMLEKVKKSMKGMNTQQQLAYTSTIFGQEANKQMLALLSAEKGIRVKNTTVIKSGSDALRGLTKQIEENVGAAKTMAEIMEEGIGGDYRVLVSRLSTISIMLGKIVVPIMIEVGDRVISIIEKFKALSPATQGWIVKIAMLVATIGPLLVITGKLIIGLSFLGSGILFLARKSFPILLFALKSIGTAIIFLFNLIMANPIIALIALFAGLVVAVVMLERKFKFFSRTWKKIVQWWKDAPPIVKALITAFAPFVTLPLHIAEHWDTLKSKITGIIDSVRNFSPGGFISKLFGGDSGAKPGSGGAGTVEVRVSSDSGSSAKINKVEKKGGMNLKAKSRSKLGTTSGAFR